MKIELKDIPLIAQGYINDLRAELRIANPEMEAKFKARYEICLNCPTISDDLKKCDGKKGGCGCKLSKRLRSDKSCPLNKW